MGPLYLVIKMCHWIVAQTKYRQAAGSELLAQAEENALVVRVAHSTRTAPLPFYSLHSTSFYLSTRQANSQAHIDNFFQ